MRKFVSEHQSPYLDLTTEVSDILYRGHSQFQDIIVADSKEFGRMLVLDGVFQTSIKDEFIYHESIVHIPLFLHPNPKKVLIIGGGDGGAAREAVRHPEVESVTMVDIDHTKCLADIQYASSKTDKKGSQIAVLKTVYEIDPDIPLLARYPSSTLKEIRSPSPLT